MQLPPIRPHATERSGDPSLANGGDEETFAAAVGIEQGAVGGG
jgi:hypothetical protein